MPTYDYVCDSCQHEFEAFEPITADPQRVCPECHQESLRRKLGPGAAILFKGSGFYQTDYRSESYKKAAKSEKSEGSPAKSEGSTSSKSETPAAASSSPSASAKPSSREAAS
jgi:putative FmdB family regulatory protein